MAAIAPRTWNETDIPAVAAADLASALSLWLARERRGMVVVGEAPVATTASIEKAVIALFDCPARGLAVLYRLRCLTAALGTLRFRHLVRAENAGCLAALTTTAATLRLNPTWGISPLKMAWAMRAAEKPEVREAA